MAIGNTTVPFALAVCLLAQPVSAQTIDRPSLSLDGARKLIAAAEHEAERIGAPGVIAVVDGEGQLIALERMDNAPMLASIPIAMGKARSAALYGKPTKDLEDAINGGRAAALSVPDMVQMQGGLPARVNGKLVGAIGVSADNKDHDQAIATAAIETLQK